MAYMGRCLRCAEEQRQGGTEEQDIVWENYQEETSRSIVSRAREHYADYLAAMKKPPPPPTRHRDESPGQAGGGGARGVDWREEEDEEGSSWMADHSRARHRGLASADPREDYDFGGAGPLSKAAPAPDRGGGKDPPGDAERFPPSRPRTNGQEDKTLPSPLEQEDGEF